MFHLQAQLMALPFLNAAAMCRSAERQTTAIPMLSKYWGDAARYHARGAEMLGQKSRAHLQIVAHRQWRRPTSDRPVLRIIDCRR